MKSAREGKAANAAKGKSFVDCYGIASIEMVAVTMAEIHVKKFDFLCLVRLYLSKKQYLFLLFIREL